MVNNPADILEIALLDYFEGKHGCPELWIHNKFGEPDLMLPEVYFRDISGMPDIEVFALSNCRGRVLDVGAGTGAHTIYLQDIEKDVTALELSEIECGIMQKLGVKKIVNADFFHYRTTRKFDTLLFMMNGIGMPGNLKGLEKLLDHSRNLLNPLGIILFDSSNVAYIRKENLMTGASYYGEIEYRYQYGDKWGAWFNWLYIDQDQMKNIAKKKGWELQVLYEDETDHYLGRLIVIN